MADTMPDLVIDGTAKIHQRDNDVKQNHTASWKAVLVKWVSSVIFALLFLTCLVHSKLTLLALSEAMNADNKLDLISRSRIFVMLQIVALVPHVINIVRGIWCGLLRRDRKYPLQLNKWILATVMSLLEAFGICLFVFCIPGLSKPHHTILLMNCVFFVPLLDNIRCLWINRHRQTDEQSRLRSNYPGGKKVNVFWTMALIAELIGLGFTGYLMRNVPLSKIWIVPIGVVCVSIPWIPSVQKYLVENIYERQSVFQIFQDSANEAEPSTSATNNIQGDFLSSTEKVTFVTKIERTAWKLTTWMSFVKLLSTMGFSMIIYFNDTLSPFPNELNKVDMKTYMDGWHDWRDSSKKELLYVGAHISAGFVGYLVGYVACTTRSQLVGFSIPLMAATPLSVILLAVFDTCRFFLLYPGVVHGKHECTITDKGIAFLTLATFFLVLAQVLSTWWLLLRSQLIVMLGEDQLFWTPMYNSALLEHWIMLSRRNELTDIGNVDLNPVEKARRSRIYICTTMYRETEEEMKQLLESLQEMNDRVTHSRGLQFESHIFFDGAVRKDIPTEFLSQLVALVEETLDTKAQRCTKLITPYGMSLSWRLVSQSKEGMPFTIHLKDNSKVKNKKRWSQVMYMSFVLDFQLKNCHRTNENYDMEEESYILTTDADVKFTPDNVEALLDLMTRDYSVGAVCARTHPLGSGPVVWYQKFEYAIGHWFQKAAEHVIGCVLCSPGCFSVYRCKALRDVLPIYATNVEKAEEFLTKDMGEDRWLCTLMVQSGWRIEYCAASENKTHCPEDFDEFFKQRRRWIASTLANLWLLIKEWKYIRKYNLRVSVLFLIYQVILLVATLIGPSSIILVVSGGLTYGKNLNPEATMSLQLVLCVCFTVICLYTSQKVQLYAAKGLTCFYAVIMMIVIVGTAVQIVVDIKGYPGSEHNFISDKIQISTTSVYLFTTAAVFITAGIFHLREITCLFHGFVYLLFLPSGYLLLIIYSICNITDSSWGTRESTEQASGTTDKSWRRKFKELIQTVFFCCSVKEKKEDSCRSVETRELGTQVSPATHRLSVNRSVDEPDISSGQTPHREMPDDNISVSSQSSSLPIDDVDASVEDWLGPDMTQEAQIFRRNGFEKTSFISGMTEKEIKDLGIRNKGTISSLRRRIEQLKDFEIPADVPENVESWLSSLDLLEYRNNFIRNKITTQKEMEILKDYKIKEIRNELGIRKIGTEFKHTMVTEDDARDTTDNNLEEGHIKRLLKGISKLRKPTKAEQKRARIQKLIKDKIPVEDDSSDAYKFWKHLTKRCLIPQSAVFESDDHLRAKLAELRNRWLAIFTMINLLWLILITTLADKGKILGVFGSNPVGFCVIVLFGLVLIVQFFAMIIHRISTLMHFLGRTPYKCNSKYNSSWMFDYDDMNALNEEERKQFDETVEKANKCVFETDDETTPLLGRR